jgi:hypothetical protein
MPEWEPLGDEMRSGAAAASWGEFETQIFAIRPDGGLWNRYWDGDRWHDWETLGGTFIGQPASSAKDAGRIDVMAVGEDGLVHHRWWDGNAWVPWRQISDSPLDARAVACSWIGDRLDVFVWGGDGQLWYLALRPGP